MSDGVAIRKPVTQLDAADLRAFPIWEYCHDEEGDGDAPDETWVRPVESSLLPAKCGSLQVAAAFTLRDGTNLEGLVDLTTDPAVYDLIRPLFPHARMDELRQPFAVVFLPDGRAYVPKRFSADFKVDRDDLVSRLGGDPDTVYPVRYRLRVLVEGEQELRVGALR